jgi:hypothetical protein
MSIDLSSDQPSRRRTSAGTYCFRCRNPRYAFFIFILKDCTACGSGNSSKVSQDGRQKPERPSAVFASVATAAAGIFFNPDDLLSDIPFRKRITILPATFPLYVRPSGNLKLHVLFSQKQNPKHSGTEQETKGQCPNRNGDGHLTKQQLTLIGYYYENHSHHWRKPSR